MSHRISRRNFFQLGALGGAAAALSACAPQQAAFNPSGPGIIDTVVPYATGGGTDSWARFIAPYFADVLEDAQRFQIENITGGESVTGTNAYVDSGVNDGSYLLVSSGTTYFNGILEQENVRYDFTGMTPLVLHGTGSVMYSGADSGITSMQELLERGTEATFGGISAAGLDLLPVLAVEVLGGGITSVYGFEGNGPIRLALARGEIDVGFDTTSTYLGQIKPEVDAGEAFPLLSVGVLDDNGEVVRDPAMPEIPTLEEIHRDLHGTGPSGPAYEAYQAFVTSGFYYQKGFWTNAGDDDDELQDLYAEAVETLNSDEQFLEEAAGALGGYELMPGKGNFEAFRDSLNISQETLDFTKTFLTEEHGAALA
ncbi:twin-arginine translocation signal domain-containing protein [Nesterenkonia cremea]|uniref:Tripartite-type tricarboxylate transporter, receptor component TctC n=1 Tax=Nesterenkonia cremea TaxID=1882340 RepID=A0A917EMC7_9MICC|nr:twin-arginine translocation signal domain-containing protein [Nesterenkonia cremea]GGE60981.1 hypothetical protein GCM10011401_04850 [Nesterenkonia cremea]